jgi:hypothetical protein
MTAANIFRRMRPHGSWAIATARICGLSSAGFFDRREDASPQAAHRFGGSPHMGTQL